MSIAVGGDALDLMDGWGPEKIVCVSDRRTGMKGILVIDNTARGMGKGGTRMGPAVSVGEIARLARTMTWKWAAVDLFFGGAKAGIRGDPAGIDKELVLRAFARKLSNEIPSEYVVGLDMGLTENDAAVVADELGDRGAAVGTPAALGGVPYDQLGVTGFGVAEATAAAAVVAGFALAGSRVAIQGFGAVGAAAAERLHDLGAVIVAVSTAKGALHHPDGLDVPALLRCRAEAGDDVVLRYAGIGAGIDGQGDHGVNVLPLGAELTVPSDIAIPAALQDTVDVTLAAQLTARLVVEGANLPCTLAAQHVLRQRGVTVVPDFIANAGGVIAAAFAMDARRSPFRADPTGIFELVATKMRDNTVAVLTESNRRGISSHAAALAMAQQRVAAAMAVRGQPVPDLAS